MRLEVLFTGNHLNPGLSLTLQVVISKRRTVQLGRSSGSFFLLFAMKVAGPHAHS